MDFLLGSIYVCVYILFLNCFGQSFFSDKKEYSFNLLTGFIIYTGLQSVVGIYVQLFNRQFSEYNIIMMMLLFISLCWIIYRHFKREKNQENSWLDRIKDHIKNNWFIYFICVVLTTLSVVNITYQWSGNHLDDGYYLNYIANAPFYDGLADMNHATGLSTEISFVRLINTFELDAAFWSQLFSIQAPIFTKYFLTFVNYFLISNGIMALAYVAGLYRKKEKMYIQFLCFPMLFFMYPGDFLTNTKILVLQDSWQFNTAIWYGSSIVRHLGLILIGVILLGKDITFSRKVFLILLAMLALISRATQAVPVIYLMTMIITTVLIIKCIKNKLIKITLIGIQLFFILSINVFVQAELSYMIGQMQNLLTPLVIVVVLIILISTFKVPSYRLKIWNIMLVYISFLIFVPFINTWFITLSTYNFVIGRTVTLLVFTMIITAVINIVDITSVKKVKTRAVFPITISIALIGFFAFNVKAINDLTESPVGKVRYSISQTIQNKVGIPKITKDLSLALQNISDKINNEIAILSPTWINYGGTAHAMAIGLRTYAPDVLIISAIPRYPDMMNESIYKGFDQNSQNIFEVFDSSSGENTDELKKLLEEYPIDYVVVTNQAAADSAISNLGMELSSRIYDENVNITMYILKVNK